MSGYSKSETNLRVDVLAGAPPAFATELDDPINVYAGVSTTLDLPQVIEGSYTFTGMDVVATVKDSLSSRLTIAGGLSDSKLTVDATGLEVQSIRIKISLKDTGGPNKDYFVDLSIKGPTLARILAMKAFPGTKNSLKD